MSSSKLIYLDLPEGTGEPLKSLEDKLQIEARLKTLGVELDNFITELGMRGYQKAKRYVENAKEQIFTYVKTWLQSGVVSPKVTSLVERMMREIKRRIKRIGFAWSEKGAQKMTRLVLMQLSSTKHHWENHWNQKMGINANIKLSFLGIDVKSPQENPT
jgi:transposase-like protein